jgi:hypothetical protein
MNAQNIPGLQNNGAPGYFPQNQLFSGALPERDPTDVFEKMLLRECEKNSRKTVCQAPTQAGFNSYNFMRASSTLAIVTDMGGEPGISRLDDAPVEPDPESAEEAAAKPSEGKPLPREPVVRAGTTESQAVFSQESNNLLKEAQDLESELRRIDEEETHLKAVNERL